MKGDERNEPTTATGARTQGRESRIGSGFGDRKGSVWRQNRRTNHWDCSTNLEMQIWIARRIFIHRDENDKKPTFFMQCKQHYNQNLNASTIYRSQTHEIWVLWFWKRTVLETFSKYICYLNCYPRCSNIIPIQCTMKMSCHGAIAIDKHYIVALGI